MPSVKKVSIVRYEDQDGNRADKTTPGAIKVQCKSKKYYGIFRHNGVLYRRPLSTDKASAIAMLGDILKKLERQKSGLDTGLSRHAKTPLSSHLVDFQASMVAKGVSHRHWSERSRTLLAVVNGCRWLTAPDMSADALDAFLASLKGVSSRTRETYRSSAVAFANWLVVRGRIPANPLLKSSRQSGPKTRVRRALSANQIQLLLDAARRRPVLEFTTIRRGIRKGQSSGRLKDTARDKLERLGQERALIYKTAVLTGLRRGEIEALRVGDLSLGGAMPALMLPGQFTKNGKPAKLLLVPEFAKEIQAWISYNNKLAGDRLFSVPNSMMKTLLADLKLAGIPYKDEAGRAADFHALRMSADTLLGIAGVPARLRMLFMRHSDIRLTLETYDDSSLYEMKDVVLALENLGLR